MGPPTLNARDLQGHYGIFGWHCPIVIRNALKLLSENYLP